MLHQGDSKVRLSFFVLVTLLACGVIAPLASAAQTVPNGVQRVFADDNTNIDIDGKDDWRVDVDVAILDLGIDLDHPDLNVVGGVDCYEASSVEECEENTANLSGPEGDLNPPETDGHGTGIAGTIGAIDNDFGTVGVAPGARIWSVDTRVIPKNLEERVFDLDSYVAAIEWIDQHNLEHPDEDIEVVVPVLACSVAEPGPECFGDANLADVQEALEGSMATGVVYMAGAGNHNGNTNELFPQVIPGLINASVMVDFDTLPGGQQKTPSCAGTSYPELSSTYLDDTKTPSSGWGNLVDIAAPAFCIANTQPGGTYSPGKVGGAASSGAPHVVGAVALLASMAAHEPDDVEDIEALGEVLYGTGSCNEATPKVGAGNCGWTDNSGDGVKEPLLDLHDASLIAPEMVPGSEAAGIDSDVNGDGRADLVTLRANGVAYVHPGGTDAKFGTGVASFSGKPLDPAQYDGEGEYVVDVADVNGDKRSDLVTLRSQGNLAVYFGESNYKFNENAVVSNMDLDPGLLAAGGDEPIAIADVNGDVYGDFVYHDGSANAVMVSRGAEHGYFEGGEVARASVSSALHTDSGHYFVDVADVNNDNHADLVTMTSSDNLNVFAGKSGGSFAAPVVSQAGSIDPAMDDGSGYEPVGVGDATKDGYADLALVKSGTVYLYPGSATGSFGTAATSFAGTAPSTTFGGGVVEMLGLLDVNGDAYSDLVGVISTNNRARAILGQASGVFATAVTTTSPTFPSTQHFKNQNSTGNEFASEKPSWRRQGCSAGKCPAYVDQPLHMLAPAGSPCNPCNDTGFEGLISAENSSHETLGGCDVEFDIRVEYLGELEATNVKAFNCYYGMASAVACELPWQGELRLTHSGEIKVDLATCLKGALTGPIHHDLTYGTEGEESELGIGIEYWEQVSKPEHYSPFGISGSEFYDQYAADNVRVSDEE